MLQSILKNLSHPKKSVSKFSFFNSRLRFYYTENLIHKVFTQFRWHRLDSNLDYFQMDRIPLQPLHNHQYSHRGV